MTSLRLTAIAILLAGLSVAASAQTPCQASGIVTLSATSNGQLQCGSSAPIVVGTEDVYCPKGASPEPTHGTPNWPATDGPATTPTQCIHTGTDATPSIGNIYTPANSTNLTNVLLSANGGTPVNSDGTTGGGTLNLSCGDVITLSTGATYVGSTGSPPNFIFPNLACDGLHWITVESSSVTIANIANGTFPAEGVRATPCIAGIANDSVNARSKPGYPDYTCASFPTVLTAKIQQPANSLSSAITFASGANHYRFIGVEFAKNPAFDISQIISLATDGLTLGAHDIIIDRSYIHGDPWVAPSAPAAESGQGMNAKNSQWIAMVNSWNDDTYCNASCSDSHAYGAGTGIVQDGPHKLYNNLLATAGENWFFGGGGQGPGTPNTTSFEARSNYNLKPLTWMVPINTCAFYYQAITKNLSEFKNMTFAFIEGNVFENSWQGCQSDQSGYAYMFTPSAQNNHQGLTATFDGSAIVTTTGSFTHHTGANPSAGGPAGNPVDATNCPPGGCILEDSNPPGGGARVDYVFCNGSNGCDQSSIPNQKCGTGSNLGLACTTNAQCPQSYCAPTTSARIATTAAGLPPAGTRAINACVPSDCPNCQVRNVLWRLNEVYNATNGILISTGLSSICRDQAAGMSGISIPDNLFHGMSREMSNGNDPYPGSTIFALSNGVVPPSVISLISIRHNTIAVVQGSQTSDSGLGNMIDHTGSQYMSGIEFSDNMTPASLSIAIGQGSKATRGIGGNPGVANTYAINACQQIYPNDVVGQVLLGVTLVDGVQSFTFPGLPGGGTNYFVNFNGQYTAITGQTATAFTITAATHAGDTVNVRDLTPGQCLFTFRSNVMGAGVSGQMSANGEPTVPAFFGAGQPEPPYPNFVNGVTVPYACGGGGILPCVLDEGVTPGSFINNFTSWGVGRTGNFSVASSSPYYQTASDAGSRPSTGQSPGADLTLLSTKTLNVIGTPPASCGTGYVLIRTTCFPALTITTSTLPTGTQGIPYNGALAASFGASQYWAGFKSWWLETIPASCGGSCGTLGSSGLVITRGGIVNGPIPILTISRTGCPAACLSNYTVSPKISGGGWVIGQVVTLASFINGGSGVFINDGSFAGTCTISASGTNSFSCGLTNGVNVNIAAHAPTGPVGVANGCGITTQSKCDSTVAFAPLTAGSYTFWVGARDGAFQVARRQVNVTIAVGGGSTIYRPTTVTVLQNGSGTASLNLGFDGNNATFGTAHFTQSSGIAWDLVYKGFPVAVGSPTSATLTVISDNYTGGVAVPVANAQYSINGGTSWTVLYSGAHGFQGAPVTDTVSLAPSQDLTKVQVRFQATDCTGAVNCFVNGEFYESWITTTP